MSNAAPATKKLLAEIRAEMARQSVTQMELASRVPISVTRLARRLSGRTELTVDEYLTIANALEISPAALIARVEDDEPPAAVSGRGSRTRHPSGERNGQ